MVQGPLADERRQISPEHIEKFLTHARNALVPVRAMVLKAFRQGIAAEIKPDRSLVTEADRAAELLIRDRLLEAFPGHGFLGEEHGRVAGEGEFLWIVDPIDGTQSFLNGVPTFGTMLSLEFLGKPLVGIIDHPALGLEYFAGYGLGTACNGVPVRIRDSALSQDGWIDGNEIICVNTRSAFAQNRNEHKWDDFVRRTKFFRIYYDCFGLSCAVAGQAGAMVEFNAPHWDVGPVRLLTEEAGGACFELPRWTDGSGLERHSLIFGKPSIAGRLYEFFQS